MNLIVQAGSCVALTAVVASIPYPASAQSPASVPPQTIACEGPFAKNATHAQLVKMFGATNVSFEEVDGAEGEKLNATVLFAKNEAKRVEIFWNDEAKRAKPATIAVKEPSDWGGPFGLRMGMSLTEVVQLNGQPMTLNGFEWDYGGYVTNLKGKLATVPGNCTVSLRFSPSVDIPSGKKYQAIVGEKQIKSDNALLQSVKPKLTSWSLGYPE